MTPKERENLIQQIRRESRELQKAPVLISVEVNRFIKQFGTVKKNDETDDRNGLVRVVKEEDSNFLLA